MTDIDDVSVVQSQPEFVSSNVVINFDTVIQSPLFLSQNL